MEKKSAADHESGVVEARIIVKGLVQGVGFRAATRYLAIGMDLPGTVRNLTDGSVEIVIQGTTQQMERFLSRLENESAGRIDSTVITYTRPHHLFEMFNIVR